MSIAYWTITIAGAVTLVIEASRQFSSPIDVHPHDRYPILKGVDISALCTSGELIRGFLMYVSLYLGAYITILGSTELYDIIVGRSAEDADNIEIFGKPIFISATIIAALSMGIFSPIEKSIRSYSHWISGIPRGVYRVISKLDKINYLTIGKKYTLPITEEFKSVFSDKFDNPISDETISDISSTLTAVDLISPAVIGQFRDRYFNAYKTPTIDNLIAIQENDNELFIKELRSLKGTEDELPVLLSNATTLRNNLQALFSLLYIRNHKEVEVITARDAPKGAATKIIEHVQTDHDPATHALAGSIVVMTAVIAIIYPATYYLTSRGIEDTTGLVNFIRVETLLSIVLHAALFVVCAGTALLSRENSKEQGRWRHWQINQMPFGRFAKHSVFPGVAAVLICVLVKLAEYFLRAEPSTFDLFVGSNWAFCLMHFVSGGVVAFCVFVVVDQHDNLKARETIGLALIAITPYLLWGIFIQFLDNTPPPALSEAIWRLREIFLISVPPIIFAISFAALLEWSEDQ